MHVLHFVPLAPVVAAVQTIQVGVSVVRSLYMECSNQCCFEIVQHLAQAQGGWLQRVTAGLAARAREQPRLPPVPQPRGWALVQRPGTVAGVPVGPGRLHLPATRPLKPFCLQARTIRMRQRPTSWNGSDCQNTLAPQPLPSRAPT